MVKFCSLFSGSSGNALFLSCGQTGILIDAGVSGIRIGNAMKSIGENPGMLRAILVSHEHSDHSKCVGVMSRRLHLPVYANPITWGRMNPFIGSISGENVRVFRTGEPFRVGEIEVLPFSIPHDAGDPVGFRFIAEGKKITVATDVGHMTDRLLLHIMDSDLLMLESNHDLDMLENGRYPYPLKKRIKGDYGHLCNDMAAKTIVQLAGLGIRRFIIGHLSQENNHPDRAFQTVEQHLCQNGFRVGKDVELDVVLRDRTSRVFVL